MAFFWFSVSALNYDQLVLMRIDTELQKLNLNEWMNEIPFIS